MSSIAPASASISIPFDDVARLPEPGDNVAIAIRTLEPGTRISFQGRELIIQSTIMEGHRFAVEPVTSGNSLLSWNLPFGKALRDISPGEYVCNENALQALRIRQLNFKLPEAPNFKDARIDFRFDPANFRPGTQVAPVTNPATFSGYARKGRGVGTRNYVLVLGTSSLTGSFARLVAKRFSGITAEFANVDGVVPLAHTEGGEAGKPNNLAITLRTLGGFVTHPNIAAVVAIDYGHEPVNNALLLKFLRDNNYPHDLPLHFYSVSKPFEVALDEVTDVVRKQLPEANRSIRSAQSLAGLKIGLQCGGSDAFSGISANPLIGIIARELVRHGGSANLAETDELTGAEPYVLANVRSAEVVERFLKMSAAFQERAGWHGFSAEGNPSGGNIYRGLYNIVVKSIGAARKKDPKLRLDYAIEYGEPMPHPGFYFMDSPGNDLESISGQVASGCNLIIFTTGNGSITNFPFVPTLKVMTTTGRFDLLSRDMDFNAGRYLDGEAMEALGSEAFDLTLRSVSGAKTAGERAGHSQAQLWRNWRQTSLETAEQTRANAITVTGIPLLPRRELRMIPLQLESSTSSIGLILPTSLCSSQVAAAIAEKLNRAIESRPSLLTRFVTLPHTEGCAVSAADNEQIQYRVMLGHLLHPSVKRSLLLEHGCEKIHNDAMRKAIANAQMAVDDFGWASVQLDGGIDRVTSKVENYFTTQATSKPSAHKRTIGIVAATPLPKQLTEVLGTITASLVHDTGCVIVPALESGSELVAAITGNAKPAPTILFAEIPETAGVHLMETPTNHPVEIITALAASGCELIVVVTNGKPWQGHPFVPVVQISLASEQSQDFDLTVSAELSSEHILSNLLPVLRDAISGRVLPKMQQRGNVDFQLSRGHFGVTL